jgi:hypothetical protein
MQIFLRLQLLVVVVEYCWILGVHNSVSGVAGVGRGCVESEAPHPATRRHISEDRIYLVEYCLLFCFYLTCNFLRRFCVYFIFIYFMVPF